MPYLTNKEFVFFFNLKMEIGEKICKFVFGKFVKTCRELDRSQGRICNQIENRNKNRKTSSYQTQF